MKLISEVNDWRIGGAEQMGDPAAVVGQIFARFVSAAPGVHDEVLAGWNGSELMVSLQLGRWLPVPIDADGPLIETENGELIAFGIEQICSGLWAITPSLNMPGLIHVFVTIYGVPAIAPWQRRIIVVSAGGAGLRSQ